MSRRTGRIGLCAAALIAAATLGGCASQVQPWERGNLATEAMTGHARHKSSFVSHVYFSREANAGGGKVVGGGCGCN